MSTSRRTRLVAVAITALLVFVFQLDGGFVPGNDAKPNVYAAATLLAEGRFTFDPEHEPFMFTWDVDGPSGTRTGSLVDWQSPIDGVSPVELRARGALRLRRAKYYLVQTRSGAYAGTFGPTTSLLALPFFGAMHLAVGDLRAHPRVLWYGGKVIASFFVALAAALTFLSARRMGLGERASIATALVYGLGTCAWSVLAETLWQQSADSLFLALGAFLLGRALDDKTRAAFAASGLAFGIAAACRPTSFVILAVVALFVMARDRRSAIAFAGGAAAPVLAIFAYNARMFGSPLAFGQMLTHEQVGRDPWTLPLEGIFGVLISPGRGLLVYSPVMAFALWGVVRAWQQRDEPRWQVVRILSCAAAAATLVETSHFDWWGGWTYGYRKIVDLMPFLVLGLPVVFEDLWRQASRRIAFGIAFAWSVAVQALGAAAYDLDGWNARVVDGVAQDIDRPKFHDRLWTISESPIFYYASTFDASRAHRRWWVERWIRQPSA